jgi:hypothetical protein
MISVSYGTNIATFSDPLNQSYDMVKFLVEESKKHQVRPHEIHFSTQGQHITLPTGPATFKSLVDTALKLLPIERDSLQRLATIANLEITKSPNNGYFVAGTFTEWDPYNNYDQTILLVNEYLWLSFDYSATEKSSFRARPVEGESLYYEGSSHSLLSFICDAVLSWNE